MGRVWGMYEGESGESVGYVRGREWGECGVCMRERVGRVWGMYEGESGESVGYV